jgi:hypothetical protein
LKVLKMSDTPKPDAPVPQADAEKTPPETQRPDKAPREIGGREGPDPVRYGDWEKGGIAVDF